MERGRRQRRRSTAPGSRSRGGRRARVCGDLAAFVLGTGRPVWRVQTRAPLSGGTGTDGELVAVGSSEGEVIALAAQDGAQRWRVRIDGEVLSAPAVSPQAVVVRTVDGRLVALAPGDGHELWVHQEQVPRLSLRGTARPVISNDLVICGFDNGKVVAVNLADGALAWEAAVAPPRGRTELERLVDIDSAVVVSGNDVFAAGFQGRVAMLSRDTGQIWWSRDASSHRGLAVDDQAVYLSSSEAEVLALRRSTGVELWRQNTLLRRGLSTPAAGPDAVAVADFQGYVHWLDKAAGALAARASAGDARVTNPPLIVGDLAIVISDRGRITAFRTKPIAAPDPPPAGESAQ
ncbi:MAG TPA: outer membrane protein assembly factor BamB [Steroidobacteraceae bacterium]|nr:outer membrane protein assembly factor BamB [Steroidobacteraceae bacterium]